VEKTGSNCTQIAVRQVYIQAMLPEIGIALAAGLALGFVVAWALGRSRQHVESQRASQL